MVYHVFLRNSLDTVFYDSEIRKDCLKYTSMLSNECFSFQIAFCVDMEDEEKNGWNDVIEIEAKVVSGLKNFISVYSVENVPAMRVGYSIGDDWFLRKNPGLYPDCLKKRRKNHFSAPVGRWKSLWFNVNEELDNLPSGEHKIAVVFYERATHRMIAKKEFVLEVMESMLPKQKILATNWVHYDCMGYFSKTKPFSEKFFPVAENYIRMAVKNGQNMILMPAFTPPLDTPVGEERATAQLVRVSCERGKYSFDFSLMLKFMKMGDRCGVEYFEHSHLFTQWGAKHAPKIIVHENGKNKKMFGWQTDASSNEYRSFLHEYLTALKMFLKENGYENRIFFHISDEPAKEHLESYQSASEFMHKELKGYPSGDALSDFAFYEKGIVQSPIVVNSEINDFLGRAKPLWVYYTGYQCSDYLSNRVIGTPQERGRILGVQLYYHQISGFLNWGFNAHHNRLARLMLDPHVTSDMDADFVSGTSYLVYPNGDKAEASVRLMTFRDQMQDIRAFSLLEEKMGRGFVCSIIEKHIPDISFNCRVTADQLLDLRNEVNWYIKESEK